jgi:hypothetical protein
MTLGSKDVTTVVAMRIESLVFGKADFYTEVTENAEFTEKSLANLRLESPAVSSLLQQN